MDYEIIDVKYDEYAVAYSCQDFKGQKYGKYNPRFCSILV